MLRAGDEYVMAVLPAPYHVDIARLGDATGKHDLRLATEAQFAGLFPGCEPGAMPPFGNLYGVPVWVDRSLTQDEDIFFNAGNHEQTDGSSLLRRLRSSGAAEDRVFRHGAASRVSAFD